jgi:hypothetical protein
VTSWEPSQPWPGTPGGAAAPAWGGYVRFYLLAAIEAGVPHHMGPHANDRLDAGNVLGGGEVAGREAPSGRLWHDLTCDVLDVEVSGGAQSADGIFSKAEAATCVVTLSDPGGIYDPLNPVPPFSYGGRSRLTPGVPVYAFAEVVVDDAGTVESYDVFTGTADSWAEDWTPRPSGRQAKLVATDETKRWARYDEPEQPPAGNGDTTEQRVQRLVDFYGWPGVVDPAPASTVTLQSTTLAQSGWELLNRTLDDEMGYVHFTRSGHLRWTNRAAWIAITPPVVALGCGEGLHDVLTDATPSTADAQQRNRIHCARSGGSEQLAQSLASIERYGRYDYSRDDLGLADDAQVAKWVTDLLVLYAYPLLGLDDVTMLPGIAADSATCWREVLSLALVTDLARIVWAPPDRPEAVVDHLARVIGFTYRITRRSWEIDWHLVGADLLGLSGSIFTLGPHANDRLDAGYVLGLGGGTRDAV